MEVLPQALVNAHVPNDRKTSYNDYSEIREGIRKLEDKFAGQGRILIRPSGTEPLVRVMIEGKNQNEIDRDAHELASLIEKVMN
jgi:phosphoglucosamine mutase